MGVRIRRRWSFGRHRRIRSAALPEDANAADAQLGLSADRRMVERFVGCHLSMDDWSANARPSMNCATRLAVVVKSSGSVSSARSEDQ